MPPFRALRVTYLSLPVLVLVFALAFSLRAQNVVPDHATGSTPLPNGIEIQAGNAREQITALRDDVLRVRIAPHGQMPEDASWAVSAENRHSSVPITPSASAGAISFRTRSLSVEVDPKTLRLTVRDLAGNIVQQDAQPIYYDGAAFRVYKTMPLDEHYYGLGDRTGPLDRRDESFTLWNTDAYRFQESTDPIYKAIPFFITFRAGYAAGIFLDNTWRTSFDFGKQLPNVYSFGAVNGPLDYYILYGPTPKEVVERYTWLTGTPPLPPLWTLGFQQSRYTYYPESQLLDVASRLRADHIPADALYLDIDFQDHHRPFTIDQQGFPDFVGMVSKLKAENFHLVTIADLHIANLPNSGYAPYDTGIAGNHFVHNPDGTVYTGVVWPGPSVFPDFTQQQSRAWFGTLYRDFYSMGVAGFWDDMNEPSIFNSPTKTMPEDVVHRIDEPGFTTRTATHAEIHDVYGMENSRATFEGLLKLNPNLRPFVLTRASYAGGQRYAATWTGDNSATWNHLRMTTPMIENLGLCGFAFTGADVGGFAGSPSMPLLTKWLEVAAFQPIDRDHTEKGSADQEPWVGGPDQEAIRRRYIEERYRLMPYLYTVAEEASRTGLPMVRPIFLEFPHGATDGHPIDTDAPGEFLLGSDILVAAPPFPDEVEPYQAEFPTAVWYNYWTGERVPQPPPASEPPDPALPPSPASFVPLTTNLRPELATLPVFARGGAIIPTAPLVQSTNETPQGPLTLRIYTGNSADPCSGNLYLDDGTSYAYRQGAYLRMKFSCEVAADGFHLHIAPREGTYPAWWKEIRAEIYGWTPKQNSALLKGTTTPLQASQLQHGVAVTIPQNDQGLDLDLK
jgi:alpha-glucosidase